MNETYHRARVKAAELRISVSAMVKKMLNEVAGQETNFERLRKDERELRERLKTRAVPFRASERPSRDEAAMIEAARMQGSDQVLSEDLNAGQDYGGVRVVKPFG